MQELEVLIDKDTNVWTGKSELAFGEPELFNQQASNDTSYTGFFQPIECFEKIGVDPMFNSIYCGGNTVILLLSTVNTLVVFILLLHHLKLKGASNFRTYIKVKSSILILMVLFEMSVTWRYFFRFDFIHKWDVISYQVVLIGA